MLLKPKTVDSVLASAQKVVTDLRAIAANQDAEAARQVEIAVTARAAADTAVLESERAKRVAANFEDLLK